MRHRLVHVSAMVNRLSFASGLNPEVGRLDCFGLCLSVLNLTICKQLGSGCGSVGRAVASDTRGPRFESSHRQKFIYKIEHLFTVNCVLKRRK